MTEFIKRSSRNHMDKRTLSNIILHHIRAKFKIDRTILACLNKQKELFAILKINI